MARFESSSSSSSSKRRRTDDGVAAVTVSHHKLQPDETGPAFGLFPAAQPPRKTPFSLYTKSGLLPPAKASSSASSEPTLLAAETDEIEYESRNHLGTGTAGGQGESAGECSGYSVQYMLGVHNKKDNTVTLHAAPLHTFAPSVKSLKGLTSTASAAELFSAQKAALGSTFGTKKAIRQLNAQARNKLDSESYGTGAASSSLQSLLQSSIAASAATLPQTAEIEHTANMARPTNPPPNMAADKPEHVYNIHDVVSESELASIDIGPLLTAATFKDLNALLPFRRSKFIGTHLRRLVPSRSSVEAAIPNPSKRDREKIKLLVHLSQLFAFRQATAGGRDSALERSKLTSKLGDMATPNIVEAVLQRYTEAQRMGNGEERRKVTGQTEMKLLGYMLVVALKIDGWATDVNTIAADLGTGSKKIGEVFRSLGCHLVVPSAAECERLVASKIVATKADARKSKQAVLRVPLEFPKERRGAPKR